MISVYSLSGSIMFLGFAGILYGVQSSSLTIAIEGIILLWLGCSLTMSLIEKQALEDG
jgi:hypothetical protein